MEILKVFLRGILEETRALEGVLEVGGRVLDVSVGLCPFGVLTLE